MERAHAGKAGTTRHRATEFLGACALACVALALAPQGAAGQPKVIANEATPAEVVAALHDAIVAQAAADSATVAERYEALRPVVVRTHDLEYIAELSIRRYWSGLSTEQQRRFVAAFERLSVMTYVMRFSAATAKTFELRGVDDESNGRVQVHAAVVRENGDDVSLDYVLEQRDGSWRIINILADQVSDLALKRAEYHRILAEGTIDDLIAELEAQTSRLESSSDR